MADDGGLMTPVVFSLVIGVSLAGSPSLAAHSLTQSSVSTANSSDAASSVPTAPLSPLGRRTRDPFAKTLGLPPDVLPLIIAAEANRLPSASDEERVVCGTVVIEVGPERDPHMVKTLPEDAPRAAVKRIPAPRCSRQ